MIFERNTYWIIEGENKDGPFCSACWDDKNKKVRMQIRHDDSTCCDCPVCKLFVQMDKSIDLPQVSGGVDWDQYLIFSAGASVPQGTCSENIGPGGLSATPAPAFGLGITVHS